MPSPVGHALGGIVAGWRAVPDGARRADTLRTALIVGAFGVAPDLDLLVHDHRGPAHSLGAAILVAARDVAPHAESPLGPGRRAGVDVARDPRLAGQRQFSSHRAHGPLAAVAPVFPILAAPVPRGLAQLRARGVLGAQREGADRGGLRAGTAGGGCDHEGPAPSSRSMILPRFLASDLDPAAGSASLSAEEAHHLMHVLRLRFGDEISVFDGGGREFRARIERITREGAYLRLLEEISAAPEPAVRLTLAQAVLKGDRMDEVVRDATMMGVTGDRADDHGAHGRRLNGLGDGRAADRWRRIAIASAKQCRRAVLPIIGDGIELAEWLLQDDAERRLMLVEPSAGSRERGRSPRSPAIVQHRRACWSVPKADGAPRKSSPPSAPASRQSRSAGGRSAPTP